MSMGEIFKHAREQRGLGFSDVAEHTHIKVQIIEDLEREDFRRISAAIYGRGFVKLYAEFLQLDPIPLIRDFMELYTGKSVPVVSRRSVETTSGESSVPAARVPVTRTVSDAVAQHADVLPRPEIRRVEPVIAQENETTLDAVSAPDTSEVPSEENFRVDETSLDSSQDAEKLQSQERAFVLEPEISFADVNEPDLFHPQMPRRVPVVSTPAVKEVTTQKRNSVLQRRKPGEKIFTVGSQMEESPVACENEKTRRLGSFIKTNVVSPFIKHARQWTDRLEHLLPERYIQKKMIVLGGLGVLFAVCMISGITILFKMTAHSPKTNAPVERLDPVAPIPDLYVD